MKSSRVVALGLLMAFGVALAWIVALGVAVYSEAGGPCPMPTDEDDPGITRLGWDWSEMGYVCVRNGPDGDERYVVRWFG